MVANLHLTLLDYTYQKSMLQQEITELMSTERLYTARTADTNSLYSAKKADIKAYYKALFENNPEYREMYRNFTDIEGYDLEMDALEAELEQELAELAEKEREVQTAITTKDTKLKEIEAWQEAFKQMCSNRIQSDYNFGSIGGG